MPTIELIIRGKVQGVFYRASAREKGAELGLTGLVKNLPDGSVQLRASGNVAALEKLEAWCAQGPPRAMVSTVEKTMLPEESFPGFTVIR